MEVQRELSEIIRSEIQDPSVSAAMLSVVSVEVPPDLKYCKAYVRVLGSEWADREELAGLTRRVG